ncbi:MAG TPA: integrase arm-type DNA-binding domain-containing protein [Methylibium sp.]|uniref:tyrosine-type recombinase/integrase n=1 Tax=Methylibium sp. TaxID=2067992 RepID=UPI002DBE53E1|nr:integrase arm-type DNA-binding domain-containing protein [Methylibium sp.]HEU4457761.1 integrase arm-type DNA-binding domain-containing protein [Methylibium sp.]
MLTDTHCKNATCPEGRARARFTDAGGLYLEVAPSGSRRWFWKYLFDGKEKRLALGGYPEMTLKVARERQADARKLQRQGIDPAQKRQLDKLARKGDNARSFSAVAREFHAAKRSGWSETYAQRWLERLEKDMFPWIGALELAEITAPLLLQTLRRVESRGVRELAHSLREACGQVFRYGVATGRAERNPASDLRDALKPVGTKHMAAVLDPIKAGELMRSIASYQGQPSTRAALQLAALLFQRPGNVREMEWAELDLDAAMWTIPAAKMKRTKAGKLNGRPHLVPLAPQAVEVLRELHPLTGHGRFVFPSLLTGERPMSENTLRSALRRMGYDNDTMTPHGFRAMARTIMVEKLNVQPDVIEAQLAHGKSGPLGMAYDRAEFVEQRRQMMVMWAGYLDRLRVGADVVPIRAA